MESQRVVQVVAFVASVIASGGTASAAETPPCPGNPDAIGISRVLTVSAKDHARLGLMQYKYSLPLNDREVVLTFDDGPLPPYTGAVLNILAHHCVKATFFLVGRHAAANPDEVLRIHDAGHTIGNHSQNHVLQFDHISLKRAENEIENGRSTLNRILGQAQAIAPFFRVPGLGRTNQVEQYARSRSMVVWSADAVADDWTRITAHQVLNRALSRLEKRGKGILLLHDIQPRTVLMLPSLLAELKRRNFKIVHVVPERAGGPSPEPAPSPALVAARAAAKLPWPRVVSANGDVVPIQRLRGVAVSETVGSIPRQAVERPRKQRHAKHKAARKPANTATAAIPVYYRFDGNE